MSIAYRLLPLAVAVFALVAAPAGADVTAPPSAAVAATEHGMTLAAADTAPDDGEDQLVLTLRGADPRFEVSESDPVPLWPDESLRVEHPLFSTSGRSLRLVVGGAVNADVATIEQRYGDRTLRMSTVPGAGYQGRHAGEVRFFAGEIALTLDEWSADRVLRLFDASGALLYEAGAHAPTRSVSLLRRRAGGMPVRVGATLTSYESSLPLDPTHQEEQLCLTVGTGSGELESDDRDAACQDVPAGPEPMRLGGVRGCAGVPTTLAGFVPSAARRLAVVLGSGRRVQYATRPTPFGRPERVVAALLPRGEAIRSVTALDGAGRALARGHVGAAPPDRRCTTPARDWAFLADVPPARYGIPPGAQVAAGGPGEPRLLVRDVGEQVCVGLDSLALDGSDCDDPPLDSRFSDLITQRYPDGRTAVGALFASKVATLSLGLRGGARVAVPATGSAGYGGRFSPALHFAFTVLAPGQVPAGSDLLDAAGRRIGSASVDCECDRPEPLHTLLGARLGKASYRLAARGAGSAACIALTSSVQPADCQDYVGSFGTADALVSCAPRVTVVYGITRHHVRRVEIELASGRRVAAPMRRFTTDRAFLAILPRTASVTGVRFVGLRNATGESTVAMPLYGAMRQCGYGFNGSL